MFLPPFSGQRAHLLGQALGEVECGHNITGLLWGPPFKLATGSMSVPKRYVPPCNRPTGASWPLLETQEAARPWGAPVAAHLLAWTPGQLGAVAGCLTGNPTASEQGLIMRSSAGSNARTVGPVKQSKASHPTPWREIILCCSKSRTNA